MNQKQGRLESAHLHVAWLASTNDVLPALQRLLDQRLAADCTLTLLAPQRRPRASWGCDQISPQKPYSSCDLSRLLAVDREAGMMRFP